MSIAQKRKGRGKSAGNPRRGSGGGKLFNQGDLRLIVLRLIAEKPRHGYEIIKAIEDSSMGVYRPSAGAIYPILSYLQDMGYVTVTSSSDGRKIHEITEDGKSFLKSSAPLMETIDSRMNGLRKFREDDQTPQIRRAMDNLKTVLRMRLSNDPMGQEEVHKIVDAIDAASKAIERT